MAAHHESGGPHLVAYSLVNLVVPVHYVQMYALFINF